MIHKHQARHQTFLDKATAGVATAGKLAGMAKGAYDVGRTLFSVGRAAAPYVATAARAASALL